MLQGPLVQVLGVVLVHNTGHISVVILCEERVINVHDKNTYTEGYVLTLTIGAQAPSWFLLLY